MSEHAWQCSCGALRASVMLPAPHGRAVCYCKDCQSFARFLGRERDVLDAAGGSDIVATLPSHLKFDAGLDRLACMSLSPKGLLRWYAGCCRTPLGNTPRDPRLHYVGLLHLGLQKPLEADFGFADAHVNTGSATRPVETTPIAATLVAARLMPVVLWSRLDGSWRRNPFFDAASGAPTCAPQVVDAATRARLREPV